MAHIVGRRRTATGVYDAVARSRFRPRIGQCPGAQALFVASRMRFTVAEWKLRLEQSPAGLLTRRISIAERPVQGF